MVFRNAGAEQIDRRAIVSGERGDDRINLGGGQSGKHFGGKLFRSVWNDSLMGSTRAPPPVLSLAPSPKTYVREKPTLFSARAQVLPEEFRYAI